MEYSTRTFRKPITVEQVKEQFYKDIPKDHVVIFRISNEGNVMLARLMHKAVYDDINSTCKGAYRTEQLFYSPNLSYYYNYLAKL